MPSGKLGEAGVASGCYAALGRLGFYDSGRPSIYGPKSDRRRSSADDEQRAREILLRHSMNPLFEILPNQNGERLARVYLAATAEEVEAIAWWMRNRP